MNCPPVGYKNAQFEERGLAVHCDIATAALEAAVCTGYALASFGAEG
jgi:hypothetical protein